MKKKFNLNIDVEVEAEAESEYDMVRRNLELLPNMVEDLNLAVDGSEAVMVSIKSIVKEKSGRRGRPPKNNT
jgi:hypothetical protein